MKGRSYYILILGLICIHSKLDGMIESRRFTAEGLYIINTSC